jgi:hypothetical protein
MYEDKMEPPNGIEKKWEESLFEHTQGGIQLITG